MNTYKNIIVLLLLTSTIISCKENSNQEINNSDITTTVKLKSNYNIIDTRPNVYHNYLAKTENTIGFTSLKGTPLAKHSVVKRISLSKERLSQKNIFINNKTSVNSNSSNKISDSESNDVYGKTISFKVPTTTQNKNGSITTSEEEIEMYVPELVEITNPKVSNAEELMPTCYFDNFQLEWNADPNNEEGLIIIAEYFGNNVIPNNDTKEHIFNTDFIKIDNGSVTLNNDLFDGIPDLSIVHLILLRGNVKLEKIQGEYYKFFGESHARMPIILVKNLESVETEEL